MGKDASGSWYQVIYASSATGKGWVRAEYVQVNAEAEISVIGGVTGSASGVSGLVIQKVNVRKGPGATFESLGILNPKDVVFITGKDSGDAWMQIEFASAANGKGWVAEKYLQVENKDSIPVIGAAENITETPASITTTPTIEIFSALHDGDSMQAPLASVFFVITGTHTLQVNNEVSTPNGDSEDWIQFTSYSKNVLVEAECSNTEFHLELWTNNQYENDIALNCGGMFILETKPNLPYHLHIQPVHGNPQFIQYSIKITSID